jgi:hypothetical protein
LYSDRAGSACDDPAVARVLIWEVRNPDGGATGLEFARARMEEHDHVLGHALPERVDIDVTDEHGALVARARGLSHDAVTPMSRLDVEGDAIERANVWPDESDLGKPVILPGGEVGILHEWWNADDHSEWRWSIELSNHE